MTDFYNLDLDTTLGGSTPSDITVSSQKAIKTYVDNAIPTNHVTTNTVQTITALKTLEQTDSTAITGDVLKLKGDNQHLGTNPSTNVFNSIDFTDANDATIAKFSSIQTSDGWSGFLAGAGSDPTHPHNNMLMIASGTSKLLLIPPTSAHASSAVRYDYFNNNAVKHTPSTAVGSASQPVYVASDGTATACTSLEAASQTNANTATGATTPIYDWVGTLSEYQTQAVATTHPEWICYITDDVGGGTSVYTKSEVDSGFVAKAHEVVEFQAPTAQNDYTWYRKYADGWVEQGGFRNYSSSTITINLPVTMADIYYTALGTESNSGGGCWTQATNKTTATVTYGRFYGDGTAGSGGSGRNLNWEVKGMAAASAS